MSRGVVSTASIASSIGGSGGGGLFVLRGEIPSLKVTKALKSDPNESLLSFVETLFKKVVLLLPPIPAALSSFGNILEHSLVLFILSFESFLFSFSSKVGFPPLLT